MRNLLIENIVNRIKKRLISERKSDEISMKLSRLVISQFKKNEDFELYDIRFDRGDEYAIFDFKCYFIEDSDLNEPFSKIPFHQTVLIISPELLLNTPFCQTTFDILEGLIT